MKIISSRSIVTIFVITFLIMGSVEMSFGQLFRRPQSPTRTTRPSTGSTTQRSTAPKPEPKTEPEAPQVSPEPAPPVAPRVAPRTAPRVAPSTGTRASVDSTGPQKGVELVELPSSKRHALLIGVDSFVSLSQLNYCVADAKALGEKLKELDFSVNLLITGSEARLDPLTKTINERIDSFLQRIGDDDMVVFAFSGHGVRINDQSYLCPKNADISDVSTLISLKDLKDRLERKGRFRMILIDACRNDLQRSVKASIDVADSVRGFAKSIDDAEVPNGTVLINSCMAEEFSYEDEKLGHGVFMYNVLQALDGKADGVEGGKDGYVSLSELSKYVADSTNAYVWDKFSKNQRPICNMNLEITDFAICHANQDSDLDLDIGTANMNPLVAATLRNISLGRFDEAMANCDTWVKESATEEIGYLCRCMVLAARRDINDIAMALYYMKPAGLKTLAINARKSDKPVDILDGTSVVAQFRPGDTIEIDGIEQVEWVSVVKYNGRPMEGFISLGDLERMPEKDPTPDEEAIAKARERIDTATDTEHLNAAINMLSSVTDPELKLQADRMRAESMLMLGDIKDAFALAGRIGDRTITVRHTGESTRLAQTSSSSARVTLPQGARMTIDISYTGHPHLKIVAIDGDSSKTGYLQISGGGGGGGGGSGGGGAVGPNTWDRLPGNMHRHNLTGKTWVVRIGTGNLRAAQNALPAGFRVPSHAEVVQAMNSGMRSNVPGIARNVWTTSGLLDTQTGQMYDSVWKSPGLESTLGVR